MPTSTGMTRTTPRLNTSADQLDGEMRRMVMPGARVVRMVVTTEPADASRPMAMSTEPHDEEVDHSAVATQRASVVHERHDGDDRATEPHPEAGKGESGEDDRTSAHLQGNERNAHGHCQRQQHGEHQADALRIEQLREDLDVEGRVGAVESFDRHEDVDDDDREEPDEPGEEVVPADHLVVGGREDVDEPIEPTGAVGVDGRARHSCDDFWTGFDGGHTGWVLTCLTSKRGTARRPRLLATDPCARNPRRV